MTIAMHCYSSWTPCVSTHSESHINTLQFILYTVQLYSIPACSHDLELY